MPEADDDSNELIRIDVGSSLPELESIHVLGEDEDIEIPALIVELSLDEHGLDPLASLPLIDEVAIPLEDPDLFTLLPTRPISSERRIAAWINDRSGTPEQPLIVEQPYTLNFRVGSPVNHSLVPDTVAAMPDSDVGPGGMETEWIILSNSIQLEAVSQEVEVERSNVASFAWQARFRLHIPTDGDSAVRQLRITPYHVGEDTLDVTIIAHNRPYREMRLKISVAPPPQSPTSAPLAQVDQVPRDREAIYVPAAQLDLCAPYDWTFAPGELRIIVNDNNTATVVGDLAAGNRAPNGPVSWSARQTNVSELVAAVYEALKVFQSEHGDYLNDILPDDLSAQLGVYVPTAGWSHLHQADEKHTADWKRVSLSKELRMLAIYGNNLYESLFPTNGREPWHQWFNDLSRGHQIEITWWDRANNWMPQFPWGLLYQCAIPRKGEPVDPMGFWAMRYRLAYWPNESLRVNRDLNPNGRTHCYYWGNDGSTAQESIWQRAQWANRVNLRIVPSSISGGVPSDEFKAVWSTPNSSHVIYLFCRWAKPDALSPQFLFTDSAGAEISLNDLEPFNLRHGPMVFANACETATGDAYRSNELARRLFNKGCFAYVGTESEVPPSFAARFAHVYLSLFYRQLHEGLPVAAGEAMAQTRRFFWTRYANIGGLLYTYLGPYDLYLADKIELLNMRR
jgi:hypothetical protein